MNRTILVIGDSLACPRPWEGVDLHSTYAFLLDAQLGGANFVANYGAGDNSSVRAIKESFLRTYIRAAGADYAVVQLGIVDCAPRLLGNFERAIGFIANRVSLFKPVFNAYVKIKSRYRYQLTKLFPNTLVPKGLFEASYRILLTELIESNPIKKILLINIAYPGEVLVERSYNILGNIKAYNSVISSFVDDFPGRVEVVDLFASTEINRNWITPNDGHHIFSPAHEWVAAELARVILRYENTTVVESKSLCLV